jgi:hypothetical protein
MDKGENSASIAMKLAIANVVKRYSGTTNQSNGFWLMEQSLKGTLTPEFWIAEFEKDFPNHGKEIYDEMVQHYAKTNIQQHEENKIEAESIKIRKDGRLEAAKHELAHWKEQQRQNPTIQIYAVKVRKAEQEIIKLGGKL